MTCVSRALFKALCNSSFKFRGTVTPTIRPASRYSTCSCEPHFATSTIRSRIFGTTTVRLLIDAVGNSVSRYSLVHLFQSPRLRNLGHWHIHAVLHRALGRSLLLSDLNLEDCIFFLPILTIPSLSRSSTWWLRPHLGNSLPCAPSDQIRIRPPAVGTALLFRGSWVPVLGCFLHLFLGPVPWLFSLLFISQLIDV